MGERFLWAIQWRQSNRLDGYREHFINKVCLPVIFLTRRAAREWIATTFDYIRTSPELRVEPHGWKMPRAIRVRLTMSEA